MSSPIETATPTAPHHPRRSHALGRKLLFPALLFVIIAGFYWKLTLTYQFDWIWGPDLAQQVMPWFEEEARQFRHGHFPLWDTHEWAGQPLPGQAQPGVFYPLNWLLWILPFRDGHIQMASFQWYYVVIHFMAALFTYLLCRDLGRSPTASLAAGLIFSLAGYVGTTDWPQMINGAVWTPLVLMFLLRAARGRSPWSNAAMSGLCLGIAWLSGHHQIPIFLTLTVAGLWIYYFFERRTPHWPAAAYAALTLAIAVMVGAVQILPAQEYGRLALRWVGAANPVGWNDVVPYYIHSGFRLFPFQLLAVVIPGIPVHSDPYLGIVAVVLALLGVALAWQEHAVKIFAALLLAGFVYALGGNSVFQGFIYGLVPFVEKARVPAAATFLSTCAAAVLVAIAIDRVSALADHLWLRRMTLATGLYGLIAGAIVYGIFVGKRLSWESDDRVVFTILIALLLCGLLYGWRMGNLSARAFQVLLILLLVFELGNNAGYRLADRSDAGKRRFLDTIFTGADLAAFLHKQPGVFRVESLTDDIFKNWADYHNFDFMQTQAGVTANTFQVEAHTWPARMLFNIRYSLARQAERPDRQRQIFAGANGLNVYENLDAFPRAWAVHQVYTLHSYDEGVKEISNHVDELRSKAFTYGPAPTFPTCPGDTGKVAIARYAPTAVSMRADLECDGMVVLSDVFYPGWYASVDDIPVEIQEVNFTMRGVLVPKGMHTIEYRYRPGSVYLGGLLSVAGVLLAFGISIWERRRQKAF